MTSNSIELGTRLIGENQPPFIIAEMSGNHNQSLDRAFQIVEAAAKAGVQAIKLQTYTAHTITVKGALKIEDEGSLWKGKELFDLYSEAYTPWEWHKPIFDYAKSLGIIAFSSPFDVSAVDFLESLDVPAYKIASFENTDHILLKKVAQTGKPVIMSTGVSTISDIDESVQVLRDNGCKDLIILKCTSTYPSTPENTNLRAIPLLRQIYNTQVGLSDHTMGIGAAVASVTFGAVVIEKHFTISRAEGGVDSAFSLEPHELESLVVETERAFQSLGKPFLGIQEAEKKSIKFKRSLFVVQDMKAGEIFTIENVQSKRPAFGLHTRYYDVILGQKAKQDISSGTPLIWDMIE
jgi:pseudaminic acid synthase